MQAPVRSKHYNVGFENMRYTTYVNADNAESKIDGATWVLGGSTTFGHGISDDETIPYYLNALDTTSVYINFATQACHHNLEIEKLLLLLKKGYRPEKVIFIDGLNDITAMKASNFHPAETPTRLRNAYGVQSNIRSVRAPPLRFILNRLPLFNFILSIRDDSKRKRRIPSITDGYDDIYSTDNLYHQDPMLHFDMTSAAAENYDKILENIELYERKLLVYYQMNSRFLGNIAKAFGFEYFVFFQPMGNLSFENPFLIDPEQYGSNPHYQYYNAMASRVRIAIQEGRLPHFYDISDADQECQVCYVDLTHYSPRLCRKIAQRILSTISES
jgi:hypothetical protein